jgi:4-amino-4-deoxy-L-arabinose transferase-like glycosyltransferase
MKMGEPGPTLTDRKILIVAILWLAAITRLAWVLAIPTQPISDFMEYDRLATGIISGQGYVNIDGQPTAYRAPGYIYYMAGIYSIFGHQQIAVRLGNVLLGVVTCYLTSLLASELFNQRTAVFAAFLIAVFPSLIAWANILAAENLFIPVSLGIILTFLKAVKSSHLRSRWVILCGLLSGVGVLIRPIAVLLPAILVVAMMFRQGLKSIFTEGKKNLLQHAGLTLGLYAVLIFTVLPWTIRNWEVFGRLVFVSTDGGITFLSGHNERSLSDEYSVEGPVFDSLNAESLDEVSYDHQAYLLAFKFILHNPSVEIRLLVHKLFNYFKDDVSGFTYNVKSSIIPLPNWFVILSKAVAEIFYLSVLGLALASIFLNRFPKDRWYLILLVLIVVWTAVHLAFYGKDRFRLPLTPELAQLAAVTILATWEKRVTGFHRKGAVKVI